MKKSLIALAVLGVAGVAHAQSSVTLYGIADAGIFKDKGQSADMRSGGLNSSRLGFKGTEDLGGGLAAVFGLEAGLTIDNGTAGGVSFNRQSYVGFAGGFGEVTFGKMWTSYDDIEAGAHSLFGGLDFAPEYAVMLSGRDYIGNPNNGFKYTTPSFGAFSGAVSYSLDESAATKANVTAFHLKYADGPIYAGLAYQDEGDTADIKYTRINGSYDFGAAQLLLTYGRVKESAGAANEYSIGVNVPLSPALAVSAAYATHKPNAGYSTNPDGERKGFGIGATYMLSKRTTAYAAYTTADTENAAGATTAETRLFGVGIRHSF